MQYIETLEIQISDIDRNEYRLRSETKETPLDNLMQSISTMGLVHAVVVRRTPAGQAPFALVAGERRLESHIRLGLKTIRADVWEATKEEASRPELFERSAEAMTVESNVQIEPLHPFEEGRRYLKWVADFGMSEEDIAEMLSLPVSRIHDRMRPVRVLPQHVLETIEKNNDKIQPRHIDMITDEVDRTSPTNQRALAERIVNRLISQEGDKELAQEPRKVPQVARAIRREIRNERRQGEQQGRVGEPKSDEVFHTEEFKTKKLLQYLGEGEQAAEKFRHAEVPGEISMVDLKSLQSRCERLGRAWTEASAEIVVSIEKQALAMAT